MISWKNYYSLKIKRNNKSKIIRNEKIISWKNYYVPKNKKK